MASGKSSALITKLSPTLNTTNAHFGSAGSLTGYQVGKLVIIIFSNVITDVACTSSTVVNLFKGAPNPKTNSFVQPMFYTNGETGITYSTARVGINNGNITIWYNNVAANACFSGTFIYEAA